MTAPAPLGHTSTEPLDVYRATNDTDAGNEHALITEARQRVKAATGRSMRYVMVARLYRYYLAQADHAADFMTWITYQDPTGEHATNAVLRDQAKEMSTWQ